MHAKKTNIAAKRKAVNLLGSAAKNSGTNMNPQTLTKVTPAISDGLLTVSQFQKYGAP